MPSLGAELTQPKLGMMKPYRLNEEPRIFRL